MGKDKNNLSNLIGKVFREDNYNNHRGDNYLYKNEWHYSNRHVKPSKGSNWKNNEQWWTKNNDLNLHEGLKYKSLKAYEKTNPDYFKNNHAKIYKYDNPIGNNLDKYNDQNFSAYTHGYSKNKKSVTASIERKRDKIV